MDRDNGYELLDSGHGRKLERFGAHILIRPCAQAVWRPQHPEKWDEADASFAREGAGWTMQRKMPKHWNVEIGGVVFKLSLTEFGHLGAFPEHAELWLRMKTLLKPSMKVLNLFAYSGGVTLAAAQAGAEVCHLDAAKGMVDWARENAALNGLAQAPIRWIVDDAIKFLKREVKRQSRYDGILLDPPTFGRGAQGEVFKIERDLLTLISLCRECLTQKPSFLILSCHTPGFTPLVLEHVLKQECGASGIETGEMMLQAPGVLAIPSGCFGMKLYRQ